MDTCVGITTFVAIPADTRCWLQRPQTENKTYMHKGEVHSKRVVVNLAHEPRTVAALATHLPSSSWYRRQVSEGTKGPIVYEFARKRVTLCKDGLPERTVWLVIKRTVGAEPAYAYYMSNAPASTLLRTFVWLSGLRWAIEQCFEESKTELGMAHYEVRKYPGWHHHMLVTMLAHFFLWHLKLRLGKKAPGPYRVAAPHVVRGDPALTHVHGGGCPRACGVGTAVQSPGVYVP
jgi:SRSO17 transposase